MTSLSDPDLARLVARGGEGVEAHEAELCRRFHGRARLYGLRHLRYDVTDAEDLAQQVMMVLLKALRSGRVEDPERIDRFMLGTCRNVAHSMRRAEGRLERMRARLEKETPRAAPPADWVESRRVEECLAGLPPREAQLLMLTFQESASAAEAAEVLETTPGNVRVMRHRAIARLRECVEGKAGG